MKALVRFGKDDADVRLDDMPEPAPGRGQVKVEVKAAGVCGTDIHGHPGVKPPVILGHELAGVIVELGPDCRQRKVGDRVTSETVLSVCGECRFCRENRYNMCPSRKAMASSGNGCFAKYIVVPESSTHVLPPDVSFRAGALTEPLACAVHAVTEQGNVQAGETVVVVGPGSLGLLVANCCVAIGARVIVAGTSADRERMALAKTFGVERIADVQSEELSATVKSMTDGYGADAVFECSGAASAIPAALQCPRHRGRYVQAGILHKNISLDFDDIFFVRELSLIGSRTSNTASWKIALQWLVEHKINLESFVTAELPLTEWKRAFELVGDRKAIKVVLIP